MLSVKRQLVVWSSLACVIAGVCATSPAEAGGREAAARGHAIDMPDAYTNWPEYHQNSEKTGYQADPDLSTTSAPDVGVNWMTATLNPVLSSPVVAYVPNLNQTLAFTVNDSGTVLATSIDDGSPVWSITTGEPMLATPLYENGYLWVGTELNPQMIKLNAATGAEQCSAPVSGKLDSSPTLGSGPGGRPTIFEGVLDTASAPGYLYAIDEATCSVDWRTPPTETSGPWNPISYAPTATGGIAFMGTSDPDDGFYAMNATSGAHLWTYHSPYEGDNDFAAGATISSPGDIGNADGVAYEPGKDGYLYANDLVTGASLFKFNFSSYIDGVLGTPGARIVSRSTAALDGTTLVFGTGAGILAFDVASQSVLWFSPSPDHAEVLGAPVIVGPAGQEVVAAADLGGQVRLLSLATGDQLDAISTGSYITGSIAESDGNLIIASSNGYLYDLAPGGGGSLAGSQTITSPSQGQNLTNPSGSVTITGTATDPSGVAAVTVAVQQNGALGPWWNASTNSFAPGLNENASVLSTPGATSTTWSLTIPVPSVGSTYTVTANEHSVTGAESTTASAVGFSVSQASNVTWISAATPVVSPGNSDQITGANFAPSEKVALTLPGGRTTTTTATAAGALSTAIKIPSGYSPYGLTLVTATGQTSGNQGSYPLDITNNWTQASATSLHTGNQAMDFSLSLAAPASKYTLSRAWLYPDGEPFAVEPTAYDNVVYTVDITGLVSALQLQTGQLLWTTQLPAAASAPLVVSDGNLYTAVGSQIVELNGLTGASGWVATAPANVGKALCVSGGVLYAATSTGAVLAVDETTGQILWTTSLAGAITSAPSVDPAKGLVIVADSSGTVTALRTSSGAPIWSLATGDPFAASALIFAGRIFMGSTTGAVFAIGETSGIAMWTVTEHAAVTATMTIYGQTVIVGDSAGTLHDLDPATGTELASLFIKVSGAIVGSLSSTANRVLAATSNGHVIMARGPGTWGADGPNFYLTTGAPASAPPIVVNNEVIFAGGDGRVYCFVPTGVLPQ